jgi:TetR/AcrR family transcriptional repressor of nem operon
MARPRKISTEDLLGEAVRPFWQDGYEVTSLARLEEATGLNRRGLFNRFGDKQGLFVAVLRMYRETATAMFLAPLEAPGAGRDAIIAMLHAITQASLAQEGRPGCLLCNTSREPVAAMPGVREELHLYFMRVRHAYGTALATAHAAGELPDDADLDALPDYLVGVVLGMFAMVRAGLPPASVNAFVTEAGKRLG